jgi:hypothetical protein
MRWGWRGMVIMGYVQVRLKYPDVSQPVHKTDSSDESVKKYSKIIYGFLSQDTANYISWENFLFKIALTVSVVI